MWVQNLITFMAAEHSNTQSNSIWTKKTRHEILKAAVSRIRSTWNFNSPYTDKWHIFVDRVSIRKASTIGHFHTVLHMNICSHHWLKYHEGFWLTTPVDLKMLDRQRHFSYYSDTLCSTTYFPAEWPVFRRNLAADS